MIVAITLFFILGYLAITLEHTLKIDKLIPALLMMAASWAVIALGIDDVHHWFDTHSAHLISIQHFTHEAKSELLHSTLLHHFGKTAEILMFLMGAMAIVEMIDHFNGFGIIQKLIRTKSKFKLLWVLSMLAFVLSAIIDNLTATIVLITILRKLVPKHTDHMWYSGFIIIAANAGGAWTPIGDVTTTMLWMAGKVTTQKLALLLGIPSLVTMLIPLCIGYFLPIFKGNLTGHIEHQKNVGRYAGPMLIIGLSLIIFVPIFKTITHLPPYIGMMFSLAIFAVIAELISARMLKFTFGGTAEETHTQGPTLKALSKIEMPSVLFFLGILMTVAAMESLGMIYNFGQMVNATIPQHQFVTLLGVASSIVDNVPLVAASIGMFSDPTDATIWHYIAYAAGTGGSLLIIGSAAGVVAMGMEKISFIWYLKHISIIALLGYAGGIITLFIL
jgi:Na+/H+ antiporter NhaD/arsenite permease-like protein